MTTGNAPALPAIVLDESDGITVALARAIAAARNLSQGRGTAVDAAKLFRDAGIKSQDLKRLGLSENEKVVSDGIGIASLSKEYFNRVVSGDIDEFTGALMGKTFPNDEAMQVAFMRFVGERGGRNKLSHPTLVELATVISKAQRTVAGCQSPPCAVGTSSRVNSAAIARQPDPRPRIDLMMTRASSETARGRPSTTPRALRSASASRVLWLMTRRSH